MNDVESIVAKMVASIEKSQSSEAIEEKQVEEREAILKEGRRLFTAAEVPLRHSERSELDGEEWMTKFDSIRNRLGKGLLVVVSGPRGSGKTQLAVELIRANCISQKPRSAVYATAMGFYLDLKSTFSPTAKETERDVCRRFCAPRLLVIDEAHERAESEWFGRLLYYVVDQRYAAMKDTIFITNQTKNEFAESLGASSRSRILETGGFLTLEQRNYRQSK